MCLTDAIHPTQQAWLLQTLDLTEQRLQWAQNTGVIGLLRRLPIAIQKAVLRRI